MGHYDRYILSKLIAMFSFFSLVLISVYWINGAVPLFGSLISDGSTVRIFLGFSLLILPQIMMMVIPVAGFISTLYVFNRLIGDSELVVLQTSGLSPVRLLRPVLVFGLITGLLVGFVGNIVEPAARSQYGDRNQEVQDNLTARFLREGQFINPARGLTVYLREITEYGEFRDVFLQDRTAPDAETTYTAKTALLVHSDLGQRLIMFDGMAQTLTLPEMRLTKIDFDDFTFDLSGMNAARGVRRIDRRELPTMVLLRANAEAAQQFGLTLATMLYAGHDRIARAVFVIFSPLIAAACLMLGSFSRFGVWPQILLSVALIIPLHMVRSTAAAAAARNVDVPLLAYAYPMLAAAIAGALALLAISGRQRLGLSVPPAQVAK